MGAGGSGVRWVAAVWGGRSARVIARSFTGSLWAGCGGLGCVGLRLKYLDLIAIRVFFGYRGLKPELPVIILGTVG